MKKDHFQGFLCAFICLILLWSFFDLWTLGYSKRSYVFIFWFYLNRNNLLLHNLRLFSTTSFWNVSFLNKIKSKQNPVSYFSDYNEDIFYNIQENVFQAVSTNLLSGTFLGNNFLSNNIKDFLSISKTHQEILCQTAGISPGEAVLPSLFYFLVKYMP